MLYVPSFPTILVSVALASLALNLGEGKLPEAKTTLLLEERQSRNNLLLLLRRLVTIQAATGSHRRIYINIFADSRSYFWLSQNTRSWQQIQSTCFRTYSGSWSRILSYNPEYSISFFDLCQGILYLYRKFHPTCPECSCLQRQACCRCPFTQFSAKSAESSLWGGGAQRGAKARDSCCPSRFASSPLTNNRISFGPLPFDRLKPIPRSMSHSDPMST